MKVWITKYALTEGIIEGEGEPSKTTPNLMCCEKTGYFKDVTFPLFHGEGREWHLTEQAAKVRATQMVEAKITSLKKSLKKFESMVF